MLAIGQQDKLGGDRELSDLKLVYTASLSLLIVRVFPHDVRWKQTQTYSVYFFLLSFELLALPFSWWNRNRETKKSRSLAEALVPLFAFFVYVKPYEEAVNGFVG